MPNFLIRGAKDNGDGIVELTVDANGVLSAPVDPDSNEVAAAQVLAESLADGSTVVAVDGKLTAPPPPQSIAGTVQTYLLLGNNGPGTLTLTGAKAGDTVVCAVNLTDDSVAADFEATISVDDQIQQTGVTDLSAKTVLLVTQRFGGNGSFSVEGITATYSSANRSEVPVKASGSVRHGRVVKVNGQGGGLATVTEMQTFNSAADATGILGVADCGGDGISVGNGGNLSVVVAGPARVQLGTFETTTPGRAVMAAGGAIGATSGAPSATGIRLGTILNSEGYVASGGSDTQRLVTINVELVKPPTFP